MIEDDTKIVDATPDQLFAVIASVPRHLLKRGWYTTAKPVFGSHSIYADDFMGMGRQAIASVPADKSYFGGLAQFIARFDPPTVKTILQRMCFAERVNSQNRAAFDAAVGLRHALRDEMRAAGKTQEEIEARLEPFAPSPAHVNYCPPPWLALPEGGDT
jgi:hypothetical protein